MRLRIVLAAMAAMFTTQAALAEYTAAQLAEARVAGQTPYIGRELANAVYQRADGDCAARRQGLDAAAAYLARRRGDANSPRFRLRASLAQAEYALEAELARRCQPRNAVPVANPSTPAIDPQPFVTNPPSPPDPCLAPATPALARTCARAAALLGRWTSLKHGGVIETSLAADGTLTGRVIVTNPVMEQRGYFAGMQIMRGWRVDPRPSNAAWLTWATNGEVFSAVDPLYKPHQLYGSARWERGGVVNVPVRKPDQLELPLLTMRLGNHDPWVRMGRSSAPR